jgi:hypothetical protein
VPRTWSDHCGRARGPRESATFEYDAGWLENPLKFSLEPALEVGPGPFHTANDLSMFGAIGDSAPDRRGRVLMQRVERRRAKKGGETPAALREIDFLLLVDDETRAGAPRFAEQQGGPFLRSFDAKRVPPLVELPKLLSAAERVVDDDESEDDLKLLLAPGSSLGGARPKASVRERDGRLAIAKFPRKDDDFSTVLWETVALELARKHISRSLRAASKKSAFFEVFSSIELLQLRPEVLQILIQPTAKPDSEMFVTPRVGVLHLPGGFHTLEVLMVAPAVAP